MNNEIEIRPSNLPANIQDLSTFVLVGREKLTAVRAEIRAINRLALAEEVRAQKVEEARMISEALLDAEVRIGEMTKQIPKSSGGRPKKLPTPLSQVSHEEDGYFKNDTGVDFDSRKSKQEVVRDLGFSPKQVERMEILADNLDVVEEVKAKARENDEIPTRTEVINLVKYRKKQADKVIHGTYESDRLLDVLNAVLDLNASEETLALLVENADFAAMETYLAMLSSAQNKLAVIRYGLLNRKELKYGQK